MDFIDSAFLNQVRATPAPDYLGLLTQGFQLGSQMPWSARNQRKMAQEDFAQAMTAQRFASEMEDKARQRKIQDMLLPYQLQHAQRLATGAGMYGVPGQGLTEDQVRAQRLQQYNQRLNSLVSPAQPQVPVMGNGIPIPVEVPLPVDSTIPETNSLIPNFSLQPPDGLGEVPTGLY